MKTKSLFFAAFILVSSLAVAAGKDEPRNIGMAIVPVKGSEVFKVIYKGETAGKVKLNIYNSESRVILTQTFNSTQGFIVPVNFAGLEAGEYTIELVDAAGKKVEKVTFGTKAASSQKIAHIANIDKQNGKFLLSVVNPTAGQEINVKIYDAESNLIHNETKTVNGDFATVYKFNPATSTSLTFEVSDKSGKIKTVRF